MTLVMEVTWVTLMDENKRDSHAPGGSTREESRVPGMVASKWRNVAVSSMSPRSCLKGLGPVWHREAQQRMSPLVLLSLQARDTATSLPPAPVPHHT